MNLETEDFPGHMEVVDAFFSEPWSDGLPVVPPTLERVEGMVASGHLPGDASLGYLEGRGLGIKVWQAATSAVMAGCLPEYFPVVLATWQAALAPRFNLHSVLSSTGGAAIGAIVSGPYAKAIGMNALTGLFGPGNRANSTIGRAIRIGALTAFQAIPDELDFSSYGHGGKYSFHFAERQPPRQWLSVREQLGYSASDSTVTVMPSDSPRQVMHRWNPTPDELLMALSAAMKDPSHNGTGSGTTFIVALGPEHAELLADAGLSQRNVSERLSELSMTSVSELARAGIRHDEPTAHYGPVDPQGRILTARPEHILVMTAGGYGAGWSAVVPCWTWTKSCKPATAPIVLPGQPLPGRTVPGWSPDFV